MDALNAQRLLGLLVRLALCFCTALAVAHGANALSLAGPAHHLVVLMAFGAVGFLAVHITDGGAVFQRVFGGRDALEVLWVHAVSVAACVIDHHALRNFAKHAEPCNSVSAPSSASKEKAAVAVTIKRAGPQPAGADHLVLGCEAVCLWLSKVFHAPILAKGAQGDKGRLQWSGA